MHIHDFHEEEKNSPDILSKKYRLFQLYTCVCFSLSLLYKLIINKLFPMIVCLDRHNHQEINNSIQEEIHHIQINVIDPYIDHECHLNEYHVKQIKDIVFIFYRIFLMVLQVQVELVD